MAPFIEGEKVLQERELHQVADNKSSKIEQSMYVIPEGDRLTLRVIDEVIIQEAAPRTKTGDVAQIALEPKKGIRVGERTIEWREG